MDQGALMCAISVNDTLELDRRRGCSSGLCRAWAHASDCGHSGLAPRARVFELDWTW